MSISEKWLIEHGYELRADGWYKRVAPSGPPPSPNPKPNPEDGSVGKIPGKEENPSSRRRVCITSFRCGSSTDADALVPKWFVDGLRYSGVISDDTRKDIELIVREVMVKTKREERTEIEITGS